MKYLMIFMLLIMTSFSNAYTSLSKITMMQTSMQMETMNSDCHMMDMSSTSKMSHEKMNCHEVVNDSHMTSSMSHDCNDCSSCANHCLSSVASIINTFPELSEKIIDNSFNSYIKSLKITEQIANLFRPPIV